MGALAALSVLAAMTLGVAPAAAEDDVAGSITGAVVAEAGGAAVEGVLVSARTAFGTPVADAYTDAAGLYALSGLPAGDYVVHFAPSNSSLLGEYWDDALSSWTATLVSVTDDSPVTGIDAALAAAASITGTVTRSGGTPVAGAEVSASGANGGWGTATTDSEGGYAIGGLRPDNYVVSFQAAGSGLITEYWDDATRWAQATQVPVSAGDSVTGVDAELAVGGAIIGTVTRASDGLPVADATIEVLDASFEILGQTQSAADGSYRLDGIPAGSHAVQFRSSDPALATEFWDDARSRAAATSVAVVPGQVVAGIDAALEEVGHLVGSVTRATDGSPLLDASVIVLEASTGEIAATAWVQPDGAFDASVAPGTYVVRFVSTDNTLLSEYWENAYSEAAATPITVASEQVVSGLDAQLDAASVISGVVTLASTEEREVIVEAYQGEALVASAHANLDDGGYTLYAPAGTYTLKASAIFFDGSRTTVKPQWFDGVKKQKKATPVTVTSNAPASGIDFTLVPKKKGK
ncbi:collagen binding domain-containing protein [Streptomyces sp. AC495_CC817]|uniref:MSCRAMM family protein n=1 Tax=Streptomyces sp. AC495_CC817 TaxID=2823900 RepID=UPI001C251D10|nr:carboxypeptidase-like regulatory domain-containing protein [Streptomyces sp. AC495_CC817]